MKSFVLASMFGALGVADLAWIDLGLAPQMDSQSPPPIVEPAPPPPEQKLAVPPPVPVPDAPTPPPPLLSTIVVHFDSARSQPVDEDPRAIDQISAALSAYPQLILVVDGHADATGTNPQNERLAKDRAEILAASLRARGIPAKRMAVISHGARQPLAMGNDASSLARNRRVELRLEGDHP